jgi:hypothetical protein
MPIGQRPCPKFPNYLLTRNCPIFSTPMDLSPGMHPKVGVRRVQIPRLLWRLRCRGEHRLHRQNLRFNSKRPLFPGNPRSAPKLQTLTQIADPLVNPL